MTAVLYREYSLACDREGCLAHYGPFGVERSRAQLRRLAVRDGWAHVRSPSRRRRDNDFCPAHKPGSGQTGS